MMMNGHIISGTSICVDYWLWTPEKKYHHFLTHLHADHTVNLKSTFCESIYTSPFNGWLLKRWFNINPDYIKILEHGESKVIFDNESQSYFSVTMIDANHCPGSIMFLFQGIFGNILYTGDFRYYPDMLQHSMLKSLIENEAVDTLYLDNTFAAEHCEFPPRHEAQKEVLKIIKDHPDHNILLGTRKIGKEELLLAIALEFKEKIHVPDERLRILTKLGYPNVFTTNFDDCRIFVKEICHINPKYIDQLRNVRGPVLTILLTALYSVIPPNASESARSAGKDKGIYKIPYSDHSSHSELLEFVSKIKPKQIFPIVSNSSAYKVDFRKNTSNLSDIVSCSWQNSVIPKSILKFCSNSVPKNWGVVAPMPRNSLRVGTMEDVNSELPEDNSVDPVPISSLRVGTTEDVNSEFPEDNSVAPVPISSLRVGSMEDVSNDSDALMPMSNGRVGSMEDINGDLTEDNSDTPMPISGLRDGSTRDIINDLNEDNSDALIPMSSFRIGVTEDINSSLTEDNSVDPMPANSLRVGSTEDTNSNFTEDNSVIPKSMDSSRFGSTEDIENVLDNTEGNEEYFTMSDEDLTQVSVISERNEKENNRNSSGQEILKFGNVISIKEHIVPNVFKVSQPESLVSNSNHKPLENKSEKEKHVHFTQSKFPVKCKRTFFKNRLLTPLPDSKCTNIDDEQNDSYESANSADESEDSFFNNLKFLGAKHDNNDVLINLSFRNNINIEKDSGGSMPTKASQQNDHKRTNFPMDPLVKGKFSEDSQSITKINHTHDVSRHIISSTSCDLFKASSVPVVKYQSYEDKTNNEMRAAILRKNSRQRPQKICHSNVSEQNASSNIRSAPGIYTSTPLIRNQSEKNYNASSNSKKQFQSQYLSTTRDVVENEKNGDFLQVSSSCFSNNSVIDFKSIRKENEENQFESDGSDTTVSDLEANILTLENFEVLDRRNEEMFKRSKNRSSLSKNNRISDKFEHLLVKRFHKKASDLDSIPALPKGNQRRTVIFDNKEVLSDNKTLSPCLNRTQSKDELNMVVGKSSPYVYNKKVTKTTTMGHNVLHKCTCSKNLREYKRCRQKSKRPSVKCQDYDENTKNEKREAILKSIFRPDLFVELRQSLKEKCHTNVSGQIESSYTECGPGEAIPSIGNTITQKNQGQKCACKNGSEYNTLKQESKRSSKKRLECQYDDENTKNEMRAAILKRIFPTELPAKVSQQPKKICHTNVSEQNTSSYIQSDPGEAIPLVSNIITQQNEGQKCTCIEEGRECRPCRQESKRFYDNFPRAFILWKDSVRKASENEQEF